MTGKRITPTERAIIRAAYELAQFRAEHTGADFSMPLWALMDAVAVDRLAKRGKR